MDEILSIAADKTTGRNETGHFYIVIDYRGHCFSAVMPVT
jgi:hypothetical protein